MDLTRVEQIMWSKGGVIMDLHKQERKVSKHLANIIKPYENYIFEEYWFGSRSFKDIAEELGIIWRLN